MPTRKNEIHQLARLVQRDPNINVAQAVRAANFKEIPQNSWTELDAALRHLPPYGLALVRVLHAIAQAGRNVRVRTQVDLALINALNTCSEFESAIQFASAVQARLAKSKDKQSLVMLWLEMGWAETYRGDLKAAEAYLERADRALRKHGDAALALRADWVRARILRERSEYEPALALFTRIRAGYAARGESFDAMRVLREMGHTLARLRPSEAFRPLNTARTFFISTKCPLQVAHCDFFLAQAAMDFNRFKKAALCLRRAQRGFKKHGDRLYDAQVHLEFAYLYWYLDRPRAMLESSQRALTLLTSLNAPQEIATAEINIGAALVALDRYSEAVPHFTSGLEHSVSTGRTTKAAVCLIDLAEVYIKQGQPARALEHLLRARELLVRSKNVERLVNCHLDLANAYVGVGSYKNALAALDRAQRLAEQEKMTTRLAQCDLGRAQLYLIRGQEHKAAAPLRRARAHFARNDQNSHVAWCDRLLAEIGFVRNKHALARLASSRAVFLKLHQSVEVAQCDLTQGELYLRRREWEKAAGSFARAQQVFQENFPEQQARILYDLGRMAEGLEQPQQALDYIVRAAQTLARVRRALGLESLSNSFFGARQRIFRDGLRLARRLNAPGHALALVEAAKAQTFAQALPVREWHLMQADPRVRELERQERDLYDRMTGERADLTVRPDPALTPGAPAHRSAPHMVARLAAQHDRVANELRLARRSFAGVPELDPFSLEAFGRAATDRWGDAWVGLEYFFDRGWLYIVTVTPTSVQMDRRRWGWHEQHLIRQATHLHPEVIELVYNRTIRGERVELRENPLAELAHVLLPESVRTLANVTLLIAPHQQLHQLAFQALEMDGAPLAARVKIAYTPTLQAYTQLCEHTSRARRDRLLMCGAQKFQEPLSELRFTRREVNAIRRQYADATVLWQNQATHAQLMEWNQSETLREFSILHFATHAFVRTDTPHLSAIQLADRQLTVLDVTNLRLDARLVTLSACSSSIGRGGSGDEWISLARAFFYAGARALVASLWQVDDASTARLIGAFYRELAHGARISDALYAAQHELMRAGATPYQWAAFVAIGDV